MRVKQDVWAVVDKKGVRGGQFYCHCYWTRRQALLVAENFPECDVLPVLIRDKPKLRKKKSV